MPLVKNLPFFKDRNLNEGAIVDTLSMMTYKEVPQNEFVFEYGSYGDEFYVILEGQVEILVPDKANNKQLIEDLQFQLTVYKDQLAKKIDEVEMFSQYQAEMAAEKSQTDKDKARGGIFRQETRDRRMTKVIDKDIPELLRERIHQCHELIEAIKVLNWRKNYETMLPVLVLG